MSQATQNALTHSLSHNSVRRCPQILHGQGRCRGGAKPPANRVSIYARVSTDDKGQTPDNQLLQLRAWCGRMGYPIVRERRAREWRQEHRVSKAARCRVFRSRATRVRPVARMVTRSVQPRRHGGHGRSSAAHCLAWGRISVIY
jgi:hypothetical protein